MSFSCFGAENLFKKISDGKNISQLVVAGIESHVCVQQTVLDLLANGNLQVILLPLMQFRQERRLIIK
jgi:nicotinamidase-related amidase